jgi:hypothetical protein
MKDQEFILLNLLQEIEVLLYAVHLKIVIRLKGVPIEIGIVGTK